jgi:hypothetical protein
MQSNMQTGRPVLGECWTLEGGQLSVRQTDGSIACRIEDVVAVDVVDSQVCIWRSGVVAPVARVPAKSANAYLLHHLLLDRLAQRPTAATVPSEESLGRLIFERKTSKGNLVALVLVTVGFAVLAVIVGLKGFPQIDVVLAALFLLGFAVACGLGVVHCQRAIFRCHEYGLYKTGLTGTRTLRYEDVEAFTYSAERHFQHGAYTGTLFDLTFDPVAERKADRIRYMVTLKNADSELERLRDQVSRMIAGRMAQRLAAKRPVDWTPRLHLLPDGIEYRRTRFLGRKESVVVPFGEIETFTVDERVFRLWMKGRGKPVIRESTRARNFFAGFYLLVSLVNAQPTV